MDGLDRKTCSFEVKQTTDDEKYYYFEGLASTFQADRDDDIILPGAFTESLKEVKPKVLWGHKFSDPPIGKSLTEEEVSAGLRVKAQLPKADTFVSGRIAPQLDVGAIDSMSIGFRSTDWKWQDDFRIISKLTLYEYSLVNIPANPGAIVTGFKSVSRFKNLPLADRNTKWSKKEAIKRIREHTNSNEKPSKQYRNYFMWFDAEDAENFTAYKLPYADWIDGGFKAVPRALIAIKAAVGGARGGVNIPESDKSKILRHVERYLSKLEDDEKIFIFGDVKDISREGMNQLLKELGCFNKPSREYIAKFFPKQRKSDSGEIDVFKKIIEDMKTSIGE